MNRWMTVEASVFASLLCSVNVNNDTLPHADFANYHGLILYTLEFGLTEE